MEIDYNKAGRRAMLVRVLLASSLVLQASVLFEVTTPYHHIRVVDEGNLRTLCFDDATETRMSLEDSTKGHFEYTEYFHMPLLWNPEITNVLMIGLGGGSAQRTFERYYPAINIQSIEIDPIVAQVARDYFHLKETAKQRVQISDGRVFLRRTKSNFDLILLDAYVGGRYGSGIPQHLATKEFFELVRGHLTTNGIVGYNVIGSLTGWHADIVGALYRTLKTVFPQVYLFPARSSQNVVLLATRSEFKADLHILRQRAAVLEQARRIHMPFFFDRLENFQAAPPASASRSPVLTDDYAPVEGLSSAGSSQPK